MREIQDRVPIGNRYISLVNDSFILTTKVDLNLSTFFQNYVNDNNLQNFARSNCKRSKRKVNNIAKSSTPFRYTSSSVYCVHSIHFNIPRLI